MFHKSRIKVTESLRGIVDRAKEMVDDMTPSEQQIVVEQQSVGSVPISQTHMSSYQHQGLVSDIMTLMLAEKLVNPDDGLDSMVFAYPGSANPPEVPVSGLYTNHRGEKRLRTFIPIGICYGHNEWHTEDQWIILGFDLEQNKFRTYAMKDLVFDYSAEVKLALTLETLSQVETLIAEIPDKDRTTIDMKIHDLLVTVAKSLNGTPE